MQVIPRISYPSLHACNRVFWFSNARGCVQRVWILTGGREQREGDEEPGSDPAVPLRKPCGS